MKPQDLPDEFLLCRDIRHQWDLLPTATRLTSKEGVRVMERTLHCDRCGAVRVEVISLVTFKVIARTYGYPEGFLLGEPTPFVKMREASVKRQLKALRSIQPGKRGVR
jgi:hypothetical protein